MAFIDYYKVMGIPKDTPQKDIRAAYRKRSKQFHPDLHPDDPKAKAKFQMLNEAYEVLNDPEKRAKYDQYGENWKQAEQFGGRRGGNWLLRQENQPSRATEGKIRCNDKEVYSPFLLAGLLKGTLQEKEPTSI